MDPLPPVPVLSGMGTDLFRICFFLTVNRKKAGTALDFEATAGLHCEVTQFCLLCGRRSVSHWVLPCSRIFIPNPEFQTKELKNHETEQTVKTRKQT